MDPVSGLVLAHADSVTLYDVVFKIQKSGQRRAKAAGVRNVHAFAVGSFADSEKRNTKTWDQFTYNPFKHEFFVDRSTGYPIVRASKVHLAKGKYFYLI